MNKHITVQTPDTPATEAYGRSQSRIFEFMEEIASRNLDTPAEEIQQAIDETIEDVRKKKRAASRT